MTFNKYVVLGQLDVWGIKDIEPSRQYQEWKNDLSYTLRSGKSLFLSMIPNINNITDIKPGSVMESGFICLKGKLPFTPNTLHSGQTSILSSGGYCYLILL